MPGSLERALRREFGDRAIARAPLAPLTTFRVGGPADWLLDLRDAGEAARAFQVAADEGVPVTLLGGGSNVLVSDRGVRGLVIRLRNTGVRRTAAGHVRADAGLTINGLVRWTVARGLAGIERWAGTPGTVGGGIYGNAHFQGRLLGDLVAGAVLLTPGGAIVEVSAAEMAFGYDESRLQRTGELLVSADFIVSEGDPAALREIARESLAYRKRTQPLHMPSAGCIFRNPDPDVPLPPGVPCSAGALIELAGMKGVAEGGARVSPVHANFIVNEGGARAADVRTLVERCRRAVEDRFGVRLREEIVYLGEFADDRSSSHGPAS